MYTCTAYNTTLTPKQNRELIYIYGGRAKLKSFFFFFFLCYLGLLWVRSEPLLQLLKVFNGLEQLGEVSLTESPAAGALLDDLFGFRMHVAADALNDLQEERRPVSHRHSEHLHTE